MVIASYTQRLVPVSGTCNANITEIQALCRRVFPPFFAKEPEKKYTVSVVPGTFLDPLV